MMSLPFQGSGPARQGERRRAFLAAEAASERRSASTTAKERRGGRAPVQKHGVRFDRRAAKEDAPRQAKRYAVGVVTATALVALGATSAIRTTTSLRATAARTRRDGGSRSTRSRTPCDPTAAGTRCRYDVMLSNDDLLAAIDLTVDFHGNEASVEEHGKVLLRCK